ncbi:5-formyltetrahydrofolate cyclo-ligase [Porphyromonas gulae]|uniref:5-formyltetrahydrofolate cyclo-ligase n=1 Tax=Porphyromonas gulae TaxID=111105 RepID=A0A0A2FNR3_9PORP|nr:5-formyltetrahydrofolate cyclo-ligase [Porphyromonas gulae]KGN72855.1 5-formyltetrahydrofolate cyclo-ligase [Porphyromonas gulae]KGN89874.1 5-formyltetrahydrofolate cyclo-ligase [Porphyromonas gulae]
MTKKVLRAQIRLRNRELLTAENREAWSQAIVERICRLDVFADAKRIGLYHALPDEPDLAGLLREYAHTKQLFIPRVEGDDIAFYAYTGEADLEAEGAYGIAEPTADAATAVPPSSLDLLLVPGVAFDRKGSRMGRGKGYYDRFLPATQARLIGVTFSYRLLADLPTDPWDRPMEGVITDSETLLL